MRRGEIWWADLAEPRGSEPGYRRPVVIVQDDAFNRSRIGTVIVAVISSNLKLAAAPGNVPLVKSAGGLDKDSVINVSQVITVDKSYLTERVGLLSRTLQGKVDSGLRLAMGL